MISHARSCIGITITIRIGRPAKVLEHVRDLPYIDRVDLVSVGRTHRPAAPDECGGISMLSKRGQHRHVSLSLCKVTRGATRTVKGGRIIIYSKQGFKLDSNM